MLRTNNDKYKDRNKNQIKTLIGTDEIYKPILNLEFELDGSPITFKELLEGFTKRDAELTELIEEQKKEIVELKAAIKEYYEKENTIDVALTNAVDLIQIKVAQCENSIKTLNEKTEML